MIYVWRAPLDWATDRFTRYMQDSVKDSQTTTTTLAPELVANRLGVRRVQVTRPRAGRPTTPALETL